MEYRRFGKTGWEVSAIGFGAWGIGGQWGSVEERTAVEAIHAAVDAGVNLFDTADAYGEPPGVSEEFIGKALAGVREDVRIATKVGNFARRHGHGLSFETPLHVTLCCDASLHRMRTDYIDLYQCHLGGCTEPDVFLEAFEDLTDQGKIRAWGVSTNNLDVVRAFNRDGACSVVQLNYSFLNRDAEGGLLDYCRENEIGTLIRGPLRKGIATGKFTPETTFTDSVRSKWNDGPQREQFLREVATTERLDFLETQDRTMAQAALQFVLAHPGVTTAIPGAKNPEQARANAAAADGSLSEEELQRVRELTPGPENA
jgi:aryl-alcohol dehydrogenase-like predicted oxidoreductase